MPAAHFSIIVPNSIDNFETLYSRIRRRARRIVSRYPTPSFYRIFDRQVRQSLHIFKTHPILVDLRDRLSERLKDNMGHGFKHTAKVTVDAGALMLIEGKAAGYDEAYLNRRLLLVQCAGLLHDSRRREKEHAERGAEYARQILVQWPFFPNEVEDIALAVKNHEAFKPQADIDTAEGRLLSNCLYDGDKFRWGADNFSDTVWEMVIFFQTPLGRFIQFYPRAMEMIERIKGTFRTETGKKFGPLIVDQGIAIGEEVYRMILRDFAERQ